MVHQILESLSNDSYLQSVASWRGASIPGGATIACTDGFKLLNLAKSNPNVALGGLVCRPFLNETYMKVFHLKVNSSAAHLDRGRSNVARTLSTLKSKVVKFINSFLASCKTIALSLVVWFTDTGMIAFFSMNTNCLLEFNYG